MSSLEIRGGVARGQIESITTTGRFVAFGSPSALKVGDYGRSITKRIRIRNPSSTAAEILRVYMREEDFTANAHYFTVIAGEVFSEPIEQGQVDKEHGLWMRMESGTVLIQLLPIFRRG